MADLFLGFCFLSNFWHVWPVVELGSPPKLGAGHLEAVVPYGPAGSHCTSGRLGEIKEQGRVIGDGGHWRVLEGHGAVHGEVAYLNFW